MASNYVHLAAGGSGGYSPHLGPRSSGGPPTSPVRSPRRAGQYAAAVRNANSRAAAVCDADAESRRMQNGKRYAYKGSNDYHLLQARHGNRAGVDPRLAAEDEEEGREGKFGGRPNGPIFSSPPSAGAGASTGAGAGAGAGESLTVFSNFPVDACTGGVTTPSAAIDSHLRKLFSGEELRIVFERARLSPQLKLWVVVQTHLSVHDQEISERDGGLFEEAIRSAIVEEQSQLKLLFGSVGFCFSVGVQEG